MAKQIQYWPSAPVLLNGGINLADKEWKIADSQTSKSLNMWFKDGELGKRWGQDWLNAAEVVESPCYAAYKFLWQDFIIKHCGTKLYKQNPTTGENSVIYSGLDATKGSFFKFNQKLYYIQQGNYLEITSAFVVSTVVPYIPTVIINRTPTGGGNTNEQYNRIGKGFRNSFNADGTAKSYTLTDIGLDATAVTATVNGVAKAETTDFTVNRATGVVTFTATPPAGTNNVIITAYKTVQSDIDSILKCLIAIPFGGQNDNRMFFGRNGTGYYYWTGISTAGVDATYFPFNNYNIIGNPDEDITGFKIQNSTLCIFKDRQITGVNYTWDGVKGIFSSYTISDAIGCDCPDTLETVNNCTVWLTSYLGPYILVNTANKDERNAFPIGRNINPELLKLPNLKQATCVDFGGKYWLCINDKVYLWDYFISPYWSTGNPDEDAKRLSWWYFDNINASCWVTDAGNLYYGNREDGRIVKFHTDYYNGQFYDFGNAISSVYRLPLRDLGNGICEFDVIDCWIDCRGDTKTAITVTYITSDDMNGDPTTDEIVVGSFSYENFSYDTFTYQIMGYKETFSLSPIEKKIDLFGIEFTNYEPGRDMNISDVKFSYRLGKQK